MNLAKNVLLDLIVVFVAHSTFSESSTPGAPPAGAVAPSYALAPFQGAGASTPAAGARGTVSLPAHAFLPPSLGVLAARAAERQGWPALAHFARSVKSLELKGLAYFVLGYREYQAGDSSVALGDLDRAASTGFTLADYAQYYRAEAADKAGEPKAAVQAVAGFRNRFPGSSLQLDAVRLAAGALIASGRPADAIQALQAEPMLHRQSSLELVLGKAYEAAGNRASAAAAFQDVYYHFPNAPEAAPAGQALENLKAQLGPSFPAAPQELRAMRAASLEDAGHCDKAGAEYEALTRDYPASASAAAWRLGRDRCLLRLGRAREAAADLAAGGWPPGETDAEHGQLAVRAQARMNHEQDMLGTLDSLSRLYPRSTHYASALDAVSFFFTTKGDWARARAYDQTLIQNFPDSDLAPRTAWRLAWSAYLAGAHEDAYRRLWSYASAYPSSPEMPATLYWLGRLAEAEGRPDEARGLYTLIASRFRNYYYAQQAAVRLRALGCAEGAEAPASKEGSALPAGLQQIAARLEPLPPPPRLCPAQVPDAETRPALTLAALSLDDLAEHDLRVRLEENPGATELRLDLAEIERHKEQYALAIFNARKVAPDYAAYDFPSLPRNFWDLLYPRTFWNLVRAQAHANRLDPYLVMAVIREESGFDPKAISAAGARGLMQLLPLTARKVPRSVRGPGRRRRGAGNLYDPAYNVRTGCRFLGGIVRQFGGNLEEALAAYNAGEDRVRAWLNAPSSKDPPAFVESISFNETRAYVESVLRDRAIYRRLMTEKLRFKSCGPQG